MRARSHQSHARARGAALGLVFAALALAGCQDTLPKATAITHMRVLGSKVEVVGDETRATPKPGERATVTFVTAFPKVEQSTADSKTMLIGCSAPSRYSGGLPVCQEFIDAAMGVGPVNLETTLPMVKGKFRCKNLPVPIVQNGAVSVQCVEGDPVGQLTVPLDYAGKQLLMLGVVCERGEPFIDATDPLLFGCEDNSGETIRLNALLPVQLADKDENRNPSIDALTTRFDDGLWLAPPDMLPTGDCRTLAMDKGIMDGGTLPYRDPGNHVIELKYDASQREALAGKDVEDLELTVYSTTGKMERRFTVWDGIGMAGKTKPLDASLKWDGPGIDALMTDQTKGKKPLYILARFFLTLRDHRGGFSSATRAVCLHL
jgi:hypothetical protein